MSRRVHIATRCTALAIAALAVGCGQELADTASVSSAVTVNLPSYNANISDSSISGLSSGGFFAAQMGVAYASTFKGVGIIAGGTYDCAGQMNYTGCMYNATPSITPSITNMKSWSANQNDGVASIANQKIYIFTGTNDTTVGKNVTDQVYNLYVTTGQFVPAANVKYDKTSNAAHTFPTDFDSTGNNACTTAASPYISNCGFDGAGAVLKQIYGTLNARNNGTLGGTLIQFDQSEFLANPTTYGMDTTGWVYVPASCAAGQQCKVHVALHGCLQSQTSIGMKFVNNTGYNKWADTNNIIVLYPQTVPDNTTHATSASGSLANPNGCWDWIGWYGRTFDQKAGVQMVAVKKMIDRLTAGYTGGGGGGGGLPAPTGLAVTGTTDTTVSLSWNAVTGAASYNVYRNGGKANSSAITGTAYTDSGLSPATGYGYTVAGVDGSGVVGAQSSAVQGTTTGFAPRCYTSSNYAHVTAGRAHDSGGYALANGSNQNMGLDNVFYTHTLKQTGTNYYVISDTSCP